MYSFTFHGVTYEPHMKGPKDSSSEIALAFGRDSMESARQLSEVGRELTEATRALTQAIEGGATFEEIKDCQKRHLTASQEFDSLHRTWTAQSETALRVIRDHWGYGQPGDF